MRTHSCSLLLGFLLLIIPMQQARMVEANKTIVSHIFTEQELAETINQALPRSHYTPIMNHQMDSVAQQLAHTLSTQYKVTGFSFALDPNIGFILDQQNPFFYVKFKNDQGDIRSRCFASAINMIGCKFELCLRINAIFFTDINFNYHHSNTRIDLGKGIEVTIPGIGAGFNIAYVELLNAPGGMLIMSMSIGLSASVASYIYGGHLIPIH